MELEIGKCAMSENWTVGYGDMKSTEPKFMTICPKQSPMEIWTKIKADATDSKASSEVCCIRFQVFTVASSASQTIQWEFF
jgi:hypothetical protein